MEILITAVLGGMLLLAAFLAGMVTGRSFSQPGTAPVTPEEESPEDREKRRLEAEAFDSLMHYSAEEAYGMGRSKK